MRDKTDEIAELEHALMSAVQRRDLSALDGILGENFTLTTGRPGHEVRSRQEWLEVTSREYVLDEYEFEEMVVHRYNDCAIARSRYRQRGRMGNSTRNTTYRMTDVWVRTDGNWRLQARHAQPVAGD